ncbi:SMI1/KNR4 family protein [Chryseobacterium kwangjuense]|uniref:Knr4/Smi1-like domain-containing protein n=1 Tax=Chryseobacterium kwangjuense TaxID=267125 RepID=A0A135WLQ1_9FLAO|nr:SMI1/KNR4 family protein [Chryseobacterium kwangjuense]KXH85813.1 hypothetical protein AU378_08745 [Chryseobacterium kwangjuense]
MKQLLKQIKAKNSPAGFKILAPPSHRKILELESKIGCKLPEDFILFYNLCNGFECLEDLFNFLSIDTILANIEYGNQWFLFAEYMVYSDFWGLRRNDNGDCEFFNSVQNIPSHSLIEFLTAFLQGNLFEKGGIYEWEQKKLQNPLS